MFLILMDQQQRLYYHSTKHLIVQAIPLKSQYRISVQTVDPNPINTVQVFVGQSKDDPAGQFLTLTETTPDSENSREHLLWQGNPSKNHVFLRCFDIPELS